MKPKVSICIPAYKEPELIKICLESIVKQTFSNYEVVITDDSPNNELGIIINSYKDKIKNIRYYKNESNKGSPENWNECVRKAQGEYIKIIHHDDWFVDETCLQKFVDLLDNNPEVNFAFSACNSCDRDRELISVHKINNATLEGLKKNYETLFLGNFIGAPSVTIYRKQVNLEYNKDLMWLVDIDFYTKILSINNKFAYCNDILMNVTADSDHQVTKQCENNKEIDLSESIYLYSKIKDIIIRIKYLSILRYKFYKYKINKIEDIPSKNNLQIYPEFILLIKLNSIRKFIKNILTK
ncbi:TPA: glycosyltransferase family 2 protein [Candidatus Nomurabacteria bacterium]|uniref:Glycosyl transferase family 2 n=1 Tax=Candidatus Nomurabacteria bacterium GW2011_GWE1_35_16 TaxID=1618761 RepID=A0A0G0B9U1_9BACT|nr:MAG: Glycosyl transferase family 2 [Candidatus Nomurabacteria bacterium GW2011_GWF1_34_20]KKP62737.1 MAG: Glycosyl transferase family 2 [Candidatus Nomurabacteria bacterium GW2011_GWE2_34_25]KKP66109.1 MAG: Glycosyl transferase family 2 [Candidatus Nomurabacteria bacterium GW2011_GWE1_35_16]HAE36351.1 glycosyltransferase family 2 protein [Candidatus Nomurabacteria bacterium]HAX65381.1 glycosyltransferase family 2 protein [Candidatus Nomurabacteria bacterium]